MHEAFTQRTRVAYFSMEIALRSEITTYSGGLGGLAGDTLRAAADLNLPLVGVTLASRDGYFRQEIDAQGRQHEHPDPWLPERWAVPLDAKVTVPIEGRNVWIGGWLYVLRGSRGDQEPVILLDTDLPENGPADRYLTHALYGGDAAYRLAQEIVLGIGGVRMLNALGFSVRHYHMNEGHSALLTLELLRRHAYSQQDLQPGDSRYDVPRVRALCNFTTHTPVDAGHDQFPYDLVGRMLDGFIDQDTIKSFGGRDKLNMTYLALNLSDYVNGVAKRHAEVSERMFPGYHVRAITNGVHPRTWTHPAFRALYDEHLPGWCDEPQLLVRADRVPDAAFRHAHEQAKADLLQLVRGRCGTELDPRLPIVAFARRMTAYKRPDLIFSDEARLRDIARRFPLQVVMSGKAHPHDGDGKRLIEQLHRRIRELRDAVPMAYIPNYDMDTALAMVSGADVWLNTPLRPLEACGTSGMKAAFNGVPSVSVLDGWWVEGCIEGVTGWSVGDGVADDARSLYEKLENSVLPLYDAFCHGDSGWIAVMKGAITRNASYFNSLRMMRRYVTEAYNY